jgi:predicted transcriptional regulator/uncharacterized DUF497 family protein
MPPVYRAWISPYADEDFDWDPKKSLTTFADRDFVFEAARIVFRSRLVRRQDTRRQRRREARFIVLGELYDRVVVVIYTPEVENAASSRCGWQTRWSVTSIMATRADKPKEYFAELLDLPEDKIDYRDIPPTTAADWEDAEVLLPLTAEEFTAVSRFIRVRRENDLETDDPAVPIPHSITRDYLICLEDGKKLKTLKRHLRSSYNMTPDEYRVKWGLAPDYPMVAPKYAEQRSALAKKIGLGQSSGHRKPRAQSKRG